MTSTIQSIPVDPTPPASGEGLIFNGTVYVPTPANPGDITAVNTTLPLTGGGVSGALTLDINNFTGDAGAGGLDGAVPAPAAGDAAAGKFLAASGGWGVPPAGGISNVVYAQDNTFLQKSDNAYSDMIDGGTFASTGADLLVFFSASIGLVQNLAGDGLITLMLDGAPVGGCEVVAGAVANGFMYPSAFSVRLTGLAPGNHTLKVQWKSITSTLIYANIQGTVVSPTVLQAWEV